ncbi:helix-turn-helix transcriptional regulator [Alkalicoccobacillus murimartini]|uniref:Replication termination protein n=1 Tax=Alkalicoccobacillus murimartini TaxID=171685 RepID=A0ABT9YDY2_9BACI|nr:helix-turn-helix transcriptional regulator [Alkalicoccobacillus murimartini]MDQ0206062.1 DNA-binding PadR family transcriptional regulator [Alkalicoccobacillus murimartini]
MSHTRKSSGFLIKQRLFIKGYLITYIETSRPYGIQMLDELKQHFKPLGYTPNHAEIYRALHELLDEGIVRSGQKKLTEDSYQEITIYYIRDAEKAHALKQHIADEVRRSHKVLLRAIEDFDLH